jgi:hypothetical protein
VPEPQLSPGEVRRLSGLLGDAVLDPDAHRRLAAAWGFCPRHTWAYFATELELRGLPGGTIVLYEDLLRRVGQPADDWLQHLRPTGPCPVCAAVLADTDCAEEAALVNRHERTITLLQESQPHWAPRTCPQCLGGAGLTCRPHLIDRGAGDRDVVIGRLAALRRVVEGAGDAIGHPPRTVLPREWAAVVETLGWFAGWHGLRAILPGRG